MKKIELENLKLNQLNESEKQTLTSTIITKIDVCECSCGCKCTGNCDCSSKESSSSSQSRTLADMDVQDSKESVKQGEYDKSVTDVGRGPASELLKADQKKPAGKNDSFRD